MDIKKLSIEYGFFIAIIVVAFAIVCLMVVLAKGFWADGLENNIQTVLDNNYSETYELGESVKINNSFSVSAVAYKAFAKNNTDKLLGCAVLIRIPSIYGYVPAVFFYDLASDMVSFVDIADITKQTVKEVNIIENLRDSIQVNIWTDRIQQILPLEELTASAGGQKWKKIQF